MNIIYYKLLKHCSYFLPKNTGDRRSFSSPQMDQKPKCTKCKMIKILENNIGENLGDLGYDNDFSDITLKVLSMKKNNR